MCSDCKQSPSCYQEQPATEMAVTMIVIIHTQLHTLCIDPLDAVMSNDLILCKYSTTTMYTTDISLHASQDKILMYKYKPNIYYPHIN